MVEDLSRGRLVVFVFFERVEQLDLEDYWRNEPDFESLHLARGGPGLDLEFNGCSNRWSGDTTALQLLDDLMPAEIRVHNPSEQHIEIASAAQSRGIPILYDQMDLWTEFAAQPWGPSGEAWYLENASRISVVSTFLAKRHPRELVTVVPNGVTREFIESCRAHRKKILTHPRYDIVYAGAMWPDWIDWVLIEELVAKTPGLRWCFVGAVAPPPQENHGDVSLQAAQRLAQFDRVNFLPEVEHAALAGILVEARIGLVPFKANPLTLGASPIKVYDYLAAGLPVVCFDTPEVDGLNWVVRCKNVSDYLAAINHFIAQQAWEFSCQDSQIEDHTWERRLDELDGIRQSDQT
jgi:glycosyltransferase involved in cell wall biosynthesis